MPPLLPGSPQSSQANASAAGHHQESEGVDRPAPVRMPFEVVVGGRPDGVPGVPHATDHRAGVDPPSSAPPVEVGVEDEGPVGPVDVDLPAPGPAVRSDRLPVERGEDPGSPGGEDVDAFVTMKPTRVPGVAEVITEVTGLVHGAEGGRAARGPVRRGGCAGAGRGARGPRSAVVVVRCPCSAPAGPLDPGGASAEAAFEPNPMAATTSPVARHARAVIASSSGGSPSWWQMEPEEG